MDWKQSDSRARSALLRGWMDLLRVLHAKRLPTDAVLAEIRGVAVCLAEEMHQGCRLLNVVRMVRRRACGRLGSSRYMREESRTSTPYWLPGGLPLAHASLLPTSLPAHHRVIVHPGFSQLRLVGLPVWGDGRRAEHTVFRLLRVSGMHAAPPGGSRPDAYPPARCPGSTFALLRPPAPHCSWPQEAPPFRTCPLMATVSGAGRLGGTSRWRSCLPSWGGSSG